jgi:hypothetical protein
MGGNRAQEVNWILDLDIRSFFDKLQHDWLVQFVEHRIGDKRVVRLIRKWLKAGVMEDGEWSETKEGSPQGSVISPILANLYLHYVLDLWVVAWRKKQVRGEVIGAQEDDRQAHGSQAQRYPGEAARADARIAHDDWEVARTSGEGIFPISRHCGQLGAPESVSQRGAADLVSNASVSKPAQPSDLGAFSARPG